MDLSAVEMIHYITALPARRCRPLNSMFPVFSDLMRAGRHVPVTHQHPLLQEMVNLSFDRLAECFQDILRNPRVYHTIIFQEKLMRSYTTVVISHRMAGWGLSELFIDLVERQKIICH